MAESKSKSKRSSSRSGSSSDNKRSSSKRSSSSRSSSSRSSSSGSSSSGSSSSKRSSSSGGGSRKDRSTRELVAEAVGQLQELIGRPVESVTGIEKDGNKWTVKVEVLELERVPNTTDVLGIYEVIVDKDGELQGAQRTRRYYRSEAGED